MMYKDGFIACCKVDGKILREDAGVVTLPFGCEYSVLLKNLNSVRAQVKVSVDGTDATEGTWLIVPANGELELERYIRNGNFDKGNRFKFIERTAQIEANKGVGASDGLIRVEYKAEVVQKVVDETIVRKHYRDEWYPVPHPYTYPYPRPWTRPYDPWWWGDRITCTSSLGGAQDSDLSGAQGGQNMGMAQTGNMNVTATNSTSAPTVGRRSSGIGGSSVRMGSAPTKSMRMSASAGPQRIIRSTALNDVGITVPGTESSQRFVSGPWFKTEANSHVIVLQLRGMVAGKAVKAAVTVKSKAKCETCGTPNKSSMKFCGKCGTSLTII